MDNIEKKSLEEKTAPKTVFEVTIDKDGNIETSGNSEFETSITVNEQGEVVINSNEAKKDTEESIKIDFKPEEFVNNLGYMGKGMLGIFVVIGTIIGAVHLLGLFGKKKDKQQ